MKNEHSGPIPIADVANIGQQIEMDEFPGTSKLRSLTAEQQRNTVQGIFAGPEHPMFVQLKKAFLEDFPQCKGVDVFCGMASGLGHMNAITVTTKPGQRLLGLPAAYLGMPVIRKTEGRAGAWTPKG